MMIEVLVSLLAVAAFGFTLWKSNIAAVSHKAIKVTMEGVSTMMDSALDDDAKEAAVRRAGFSLILTSYSVFWRFALALGLAGAPIVLADFLQIASIDAVMALMLRLDYIVIVSVVAIVLAEVIRRVCGKGKTDTEDQSYSQADQFVHMLAFSSPVVLKAASKIEDLFLGRSIQMPTAAPIFVTSLARGGTTSLLNALFSMPNLKTHTYRDMPFMTAPILWDRLAGGKKRKVERKQRAHGDGLEIDLDSPEALEEVVWKIFWPKRFKGEAIPLWTAADKKPEAEKFFNRHMAKIIRARQGKDDASADVPSRYCSKNNANIARIPYLVEAFPGCKIVVPVRRPECHAASLYRQHQNFLKQQSEDSFVLRYMRDIGHYEFGFIHKPLNFPEFSKERYELTDVNYWLNYWIAAFREVLKQKESCILVFQDDLRARPDETMAALCAELDLQTDHADFRQYFHAKEDKTATDQFDPALLAEATDLYHSLINTDENICSSLNEKKYAALKRLS